MKPGVLLCAFGLTAASAVAAHAQNPPPTVQARLDRWRQAHGSEPIRATVSFGRALSDAEVRQFVQRHGVRPTAIYMSAAGMAGVHRVAAERASEAAVADARRISMEMARKSRESRRVRAQRYTARADSAAAGGRVRQRFTARQLAAAFDQEDAFERSVGAGGPIIYGLEMMGTVDRVQAAIADAAVARAEPAYEANGHVAVPRIAPPPGLEGRTTAPGMSMPGEADAVARVRRAAAGNP